MKKKLLALLVPFILFTSLVLPKTVDAAPYPGSVAGIVITNPYDGSQGCGVQHQLFDSPYGYPVGRFTVNCSSSGAKLIEHTLGYWNWAVQETRYGPYSTINGSYVPDLVGTQGWLVYYGCTKISFYYPYYTQTFCSYA